MRSRVVFSFSSFWFHTLVLCLSSFPLGCPAGQFRSSFGVSRHRRTTNGWLFLWFCDGGEGSSRGCVWKAGSVMITTQGCRRCTSTISKSRLRHAYTRLCPACVLRAASFSGQLGSMGQKGGLTSRSTSARGMSCRRSMVSSSAGSVTRHGWPSLPMSL